MSETPEYDRRMLEALVCPETQAPLFYDAETQELISRAARLASARSAKGCAPSSAIGGFARV